MRTVFCIAATCLFTVDSLPSARAEPQAVGRRLLDEQQRWDPGSTLSAAPDVGVAQGAFAGVLGRLGTHVLEKRSQSVAMLDQFAAHACEPFVPARRPPLQQLLDPPTHRNHPSHQRGPRHRPGAEVAPVPEQPPHLPSQVLAESLGPAIGRVGPGLKIPLEVRLAPLQLRQPGIQPRPVARDDTGELGSEQIAHAGRLALAAHGEQRELAGHAGPQPPTIERQVL